MLILDGSVKKWREKLWYDAASFQKIPIFIVSGAGSYKSRP